MSILYCSDYHLQIAVIVFTYTYVSEPVHIHTYVCMYVKS